MGWRGMTAAVGASGSPLSGILIGNICCGWDGWELQFGAVHTQAGPTHELDFPPLGGGGYSGGISPQQSIFFSLSLCAILIDGQTN